MNDTSIKVQQRVKELWMSRSGAERLIAGCAMFDDAKTIARAGLKMRYPNLDAKEIRRLLFRQLYGNDFISSKLERIVRLL